MTVASMTGFARVEGECGGCIWTWELKSVNARGLEVRCRLPTGFEALDPPARQRVAARLKRGNVSVALTAAWPAIQQTVRINEAVLEQLLSLVPLVRERLGEVSPPSVDGLLGLRGVVEPVDPTPTGEARAALDAAMLETLDRALSLLTAARWTEGERLAVALRLHLERITELSARTSEVAAAQPPAILARLLQQITALVDQAPALSEERLAQEAMLLATRADPREEIDRLRAHCSAAHDLLQGDGPAGRQLDFLCQELTREANTLCAKSADIELTRIGLDLKATIEQFREQVQNIE